MIYIYRVITNILYPLIILIIFFRTFFNKEDKKRFKEKIFSSSFNVERKKDTKLLWFHAASVGEFISILPVIRELDKNQNLEFLITTVSLSSSKIAERELKNLVNVKHRFFPVDVNFILEKFISLWRPQAIFLIESEIWPNLILTAKKYKIPLAILNARITKKSFDRWKLVPQVAKKIFSSFDLCLTSNLETKKFLSEFKVKNIFYTGNIKLFYDIDVDKLKNTNENFLTLNRFWVAASTHNGEENFCLYSHLELKKKFPNIITIIAPRHIERINSIEKLCESLNLSVQVLNKNDLILKNKEIILINSYGDLLTYFKFAQGVFMGKSTLKNLERVGGQNPIEPAKLGCKVYHGPYVYNFEEIYKVLGEHNIAKKINSPESLANNLANDFEAKEDNYSKFSDIMDELAKRTMRDTMDQLNKFLFNENK